MSGNAGYYILNKDKLSVDNVFKDMPVHMSVALSLEYNRGRMMKGVAMDKRDVRMVDLAPMWVISVLGFGSEPEIQAWDKIFNFIKENGLEAQSERNRFFGFNNPSPAAGSPNYGYEQWMSLDEPVETGGDVRCLEIPGGLYAVMGCRGVEAIPATWMQLVEWLEDSPYQPGGHQCLEEVLNPQVFNQPEKQLDQAEFDLYLPVIKL